MCSPCGSQWSKEPFRYWNTGMRSPLRFLFYRKSPNSFGLFSKGKFSSLWSSSWSCFGRFQSVLVFHALWGPEWDTIIDTQADKCWEEQYDGFSICARNAALGAAQEPFCLLCCSSALLIHMQLDQCNSPRSFQQGCSPASQILACIMVFCLF